MITQKDAADAINYLLAAQAITVVDNQDRVWADYLNSEIPDVTATDLLPACRDSVRAWSQSGRKWRIDVEEFTGAIRRIRRARLDAAGPAPASGLDPAPEVEHRFQRAWIRAIAAGATVERAAEVAYQRAGLTPPPRVDAPADPERVRQILAAASRAVTNPEENE